MRRLLPLLLCVLRCATVAPVPELARIQLMRRMSPAAPDCVRRFVDGPRDHPKVRWSSCRSADEFLDRYRSTSIPVSLKLKQPFDDTTRAALIEAGISPAEAAKWSTHVWGRPVNTLGASIELEQLFCLAELSAVEQLTVEEYACAEPASIQHVTGISLEVTSGYDAACWGTRIRT